MDSAIVLWFAAHRSAPLDAFAQALTFAGRAGLIFVAAAIVRGFLNKRLAMAAWQVVLAVLLSLLVSETIVKPLVHRPRPFAALPSLDTIGTRPPSDGFPSGHAAACVAAAYVLAATWPQARVAIWSVAAIVAVSRIYVGVHYPSDVVAGVVLGLAVGWLALGGTVWRARTAGTRT
jgi:undecaprenyl-diphosphatase